MGWQLFVVAYLFLATIDALLQRNTAKLKGLNYRSNASLVHLLGVLPVGVLWALFRGNVDFSFDKIALIYGFFMSICIAFAAMLIWKAAQTVDAANLNIIIMLRVIVIGILAAIFLSEQMTIYQIFGATLVILAGFIASHVDSMQKAPDKKGILYAAIGSLFYGTALVLEKATLDLMTFETYLVVGWGMQALALLVFSATALKNDGIHKIKRFGPRLSLLGIIVGMSGLAYLTAVSQSDNVPLVASLTNLKIVGIVAGGYLLLNERIGLKHKVIGALLALIGFVLLVVQF